MINIKEFTNIELRIGRILEVSDIEEARNPIYAMKVDLGELGIKTIAAGIKNFYEKDELVGINVIVVANLEPKIVAGIKSEGMILAGEYDENISLVIPNTNFPPGTKIR